MKLSSDMANKKDLLKKKSAFSAGSLVTETKQNSAQQEALNAREQELHRQQQALEAQQEALREKEAALQGTSPLIDPAQANFITVMSELKVFLPVLSEAEFENLEQQIAFVDKECRDPLLLWNKSEQEKVLLDGHNRFAICQRHGIPFQVRELEFDSLREVKMYMLRLQQGKRNLDKDHLSYIRGVEYNALKGEHGGLRLAQSSSPQFEDLPAGEPAEAGKTADKLAQKYKVSRATIERDGLFAKGINKLPQDVFDRYWSRKLRIKKQIVERLSRLEDTEQIREQLRGQIELVGHQPSQEDVNWLQENFQPKLKVSAKPQLEDFLSSHYKKVQGQLKKASAEQKQQMRDHYRQILEMIENS
jgi:hypothetical protein